jgi:hypothetical protein
MIGLVVSGDDAAVQQAFLEEYPLGVIVQAGKPLSEVAARLRAAGVKRVVPATPGAAIFAHASARAMGQEGLTVPLDRANLNAADRTLPAGHVTTCASVADLEKIMERVGRPVLLRPLAIGDADPTVVCTSLGDARGALSRLSTPGPAVAIDVAFGRRLSVEFVSRGGEHVMAGVYEHRVDLRNGQELLRHRLSLAPQDDAALVGSAYARSCLDGLGVIDGATCVEIELSPTGPRLVDVLPAPAVPAVPADAAFSAFGHSHQHLYVESLLRPRDFERRLARPLTPGRTTLAIAALRNWKGSGAIGFAGLRLLRRLTGFHSVTPICSPRREGGPAAIASFVHSDRVSVENSLTILHEYEDSHAFFALDDALIGFAATAT